MSGADDVEPRSANPDAAPGARSDEGRLVHLIRHARVDFEAGSTRRSPRGEQWDPPLGDEGQRQTDLLTHRLLVMDRPAAIYCSPFRRARQTIEPYAEAAGIDVIVEEDLGEAYIGEWESLSFEEILATDEDLLRKFRAQDAIWRHGPGAEDIDALRSRVRAVVDGAVAAQPDGDVVLVAHGGVINAYIGPLLGLSQPMFFLPENTSLNTVLVNGDGQQIRFLNDVRHLTDPELFRD